MIRYSLLLSMCILWSGEVPVFVDKKKNGGKGTLQAFSQAAYKNILAKDTVLIN